jgi:erythromycin esterase-like protein
VPRRRPAALPAGLHGRAQPRADPRLERYIGVIYRPDTERWSHYAESVLPRQYDAWLWFDETRALTPLRAEQPHDGVPETYPFGV